MELKGEERTIEAVTPAYFDRAAQIIRKTREMIGEGLNSPAETQAEVTEKKDEAEEITLEQAIALAKSLVEKGMSINSAAKEAAAQTPFKKGDIYKALI